MEVRATSPGPAVRPESFFEAPEARRGPPKAENCQKPPAPTLLRRRISGKPVLGNGPRPLG
eukprot:2566596-Pyramimonas_sp.AAC.1